MINIIPSYPDVAAFLLKNRRVPPSLLLKDVTKPVSLENIRNICNFLPDAFKGKVKTYIETSELQGASVIITGYDCLLKDEIALCLLMWYASQNKRVTYFVSPNDDNLDIAYATAIMRIDTVAPFKQGRLATSLASAVTDSRVLILSAPSLDSISTALGENISQLILTKPFVQIDIPKQEITGIRL